MIELIPIIFATVAAVLAAIQIKDHLYLNEQKKKRKEALEWFNRLPLGERRKYKTEFFGFDDDLGNLLTDIDIEAMYSTFKENENEKE